MPLRIEQPADEKEVFDLVHSLAFDAPLGVRHLYRGHARATWSLVPSLARETKGMTAQEMLSAEEAALHEFRRVAKFYLPSGLLPNGNNLVDWWSAMQHYGAPTRLLSWASLADVGLYFAVASEPNEAGALWVIDGHTVSTRLNQSTLAYVRPGHRITTESAPEELFVIQPKHQTQAMVAQQTKFTLAGQVRADHSTLLDRAFEDATAGYVKIIIPAEAKSLIFCGLQFGNTTATALFPGIQGLGVSVSERIRMMKIFRFRPD